MKSTHIFMRRLTDCYRQKVRLIHLCNYIIFFLFSFIFLYCVEADLITLTLQHIFPYITIISSFGVSIIFSLLLLAVKILLNWRLRFKGRFNAFSYIPSFALLALLTNLVPLSLRVIPYTAIALLIFVFAILRRHCGFRGTDNFWAMIIPNMSVMLGGFVYVAVISNTNEILHNELKMERYIRIARYDEALRVGRESLVTSRRLTALRAYALSRERSLGERLFEYPIIPHSTDLFLYSSDAPFMIFSVDSAFLFYGFSPVPKKTFYQMRHVVETGSLTSRSALADYWLCTLLLQKHLDEFARWLPRLYNVNGRDIQKIPKHYREALILYGRLFIHPRFIFKGSTEEETNYNDFMEVCEAHKNYYERSNFARRLYGNTYWWYFYFHK